MVAVVATYGLRRITAYEFEQGLQYIRGKFRVVLPRGQPWYWLWFPAVRRLDVRPRFASITGQEVLSSGGLTRKASLAVNHEVESPDVAINKLQDFREPLHRCGEHGLIG